MSVEQLTDLEAIAYNVVELSVRKKRPKIALVALKELKPFEAMYVVGLVTEALSGAGEEKFQTAFINMLKDNCEA